MRIRWFSLVRITGLVLVLLYHYFQGVFPGGFIGVDIFFTFSGFLITSLLIDEFTRSRTIDIMGFLKRRFYRIVPPLVFMILVIMPFTLLIRRDFVAGIGTQIAAALGFVTNFYEMMSGGSYESQFVPHLLIHTWSLALEVHYYILWGLAAWGISKISKSVAQYRGLISLTSIALFQQELLQYLLLKFDPCLSFLCWDSASDFLWSRKCGCSDEETGRKGRNQASLDRFSWQFYSSYLTQLYFEI